MPEQYLSPSPARVFVSASAAHPAVSLPGLLPWGSDPAMPPEETTNSGRLARPPAMGREGRKVAGGASGGLQGVGAIQLL